MAAPTRWPWILKRSSTRVRTSRGHVDEEEADTTSLDRDRKKNEALAARIFNKDRRSSAPMKQPQAQTSSGGSLASRAGIKKVRSHHASRHPSPRALKLTLARSRSTTPHPSRSHPATALEPSPTATTGPSTSTAPAGPPPSPAPSPRASPTPTPALPATPDKNAVPPRLRKLLSGPSSATSRNSTPGHPSNSMRAHHRSIPAHNSSTHPPRRRHRRRNTDPDPPLLPRPPRAS